MFASEKLHRQPARMAGATTADAPPLLRRHELIALAGISLVCALVLLLGPLSSAASAASVSSVSWAGAGTYKNPAGQIYGKGGPVTVTVTTSDDTKCVSLARSWTTALRETSGTAKSAWTFAFSTPTAAGIYTATASAGGNFNANNCTQNVNSAAASYIVDTTGPTVTATRTPAANAAGWNNLDVGIGWTAADSESGVKAGSLTPLTDSQTSNTAGTTKTATARDNLDNVGNGSVVVKLDKTDPTINTTRNPAANSLGWNNSDVTVGFTCSDALSGIKSCTGGGSVVVSAEGTNQAVSGEATDNADNKTTDGVTAINIDKTKPTLSGAPTSAANGDGWYSGNVTIGWTAADDRSGIAAPPANSTITGEGTGLFATTSVADRAGNSTSADSAKVSIDRTRPSTNATAPSGWANVAQTVTLAPSDALSGVAGTFYILDGGAQQSGTSVPVTGDGTHTLVYWSVDKAGNVEQQKSVEVKIDGTSPTISHTQMPLANFNGWNRTSVTVKFVCDDATSGIAACTSDQVVSTEGEDQTVTGTATDNAGNTAHDPASVSIDATDPTIGATADRAPNANLAENGTGWYDADVTVTFGCSDALSGIDGPAGCPAPQTLGAGYDQSAAGSATDAAGNTAAAAVDKVNVDKTARSLSGAPTTDANANGWYNDDVTVAWACSDSLSHVRGSCPANSTIAGEGSDLVASETIRDNAGNSTSANSAPAIRIDRHAPSTSADVPAALPSGWYAGAVEVTLSAVDSLSHVDKTYYSVDGGSAQTYDGAFDHALKGRHTITFWSVDNAGNVEDKTAAGREITLKIDDVKPTITGSRTPGANAFGWNNGPVAVSFVCDDGESGIAGCFGNDTIADETTATGVMVTGNTIDNAGNTAEDAVGPIRIDLTPPTLAGVPTTPDNAAGWYKDDVTIKWTGQDGLSGIDAGTTPDNSVIGGEGKLLKTAPKTVFDQAGNESGATQSTAVNIDRTPPTISGKTVNESGADRNPNADGWFNSAVRVRFACADALATIAECPGDVVLTGDGKGLSASGTALDKADNSAGTTVSNIDIDSHKPVSQAEIVCTSKNGYCRGPKATVNFTASDPAAGDGIVTSGVKEIRYQVGSGPWQIGTTAEVPLTGSGKAVVSFYAIDRAGNVETTSSVTVNHDTLAPNVSHTLLPDAANGFGWNNANTTVHFSAVDDADGSGVDTATITPDVLVSTETGGQLVNGFADDLAGNRGTDSVIVKLDKTKPTISAAPSGTAGSNGWYKSAVTVAFACADAGSAASGVATCTGNQVLGHDDVATGNAVDRADNSASVTYGPAKVDGDAPTITLDGVQDGGEYFLGAVPAKTCAAVDVGPSGLDGTCQLTATGGLANGVGTWTFTATARDNAGNVATKTGSYKVRYRVVYDTAFWMQPINDTAHTTSTTTSVFKAGSTVPAKFRLTDASGKPIQANSPPAWVAPVKGSATTAAVDESVYSDPAMSGSVFTWSATDLHYGYNWGSPKNGAGHYWRIAVKLDDGTMQAVNIGLR